MGKRDRDRYLSLVRTWATIRAQKNSGLSLEAIEDIASEVQERMLQKEDVTGEYLAGITDERFLRALVVKITKDKIADYWRQQAREDKRDKAHSIQERISLYNVSDRLEQVALYYRAIEEIKKSLEKMQPRDVDVLQKSLSPASLSVTERVRLMRVRRRLAKELQSSNISLKNLF